MSINALAIALRVPATRIGAIVKGERTVTADTVLRLARFFDTSPEFWMNLQAMHDLTKTRMENGAELSCATFDREWRKSGSLWLPTDLVESLPTHSRRFGRRSRLPCNPKKGNVPILFGPAQTDMKQYECRSHVCCGLVSNAWLLACDASVIMVPPWLSLATAKLDAI
jgi:addiction module HigA family antidote